MGRIPTLVIMSGLLIGLVGMIVFSVPAAIRIPGLGALYGNSLPSDIFAAIMVCSLLFGFIFCLCEVIKACLDGSW